MRILLALAAVAAAVAAPAAAGATGRQEHAVCRGGVANLDFVPGTVATLERLVVATPSGATIWCGKPRRGAAPRAGRGRLAATGVAQTLVCRLPKRIDVTAGPRGAFVVADAARRRVLVTAIVAAASSRVAWDARTCRLSNA